MKKYEMVKSHEDFNEIIKSGKKISNKYYNIFYLSTKDYKPKFGIAVGKKLGNAVLRNKMKRKMRNIIDNNKYLFKNYHNYIIMLKRETISVSYHELEVHLIELLERI